MTLTGGKTIDDLYDHFDTYTGNQEMWKMPFIGGFYSGSTLLTGLQDLMEFDAKFYRIIRVYGVYDKKSGNQNANLGCTKVSDCNNADPKELRFCVKVWYLFTFWGSTELCGVMTNFRE
jgi:hypothetical protein